MARKDLGGSNETLNSVFSLSLAIPHIHKIIGMLGIGKISDSRASDLPIWHFVLLTNSGVNF